MKDVAIAKVLAIPAFRNLWLSQLISQVFLQLLFFSLMIRVYELTRSNSAVSLMVLLVTIPNIIFGAMAGVLVDRSERKVVMFFSHFLRVLAVLAFLISAETLGWLYVMTFLISFITQFFGPAEASTIHELVKDRKQLLTANGLYSLTFFGSVIVGNVLAGPFLSWFGDKGTFMLVAVAFFAASFFTARLPGVLIRDWIVAHLSWDKLRPYWFDFSKLRRGILLGDFLEGIDYLYKTPVVRGGIFVLGVSQVSIGVMGTIAPGFADKVLKIPVADVSVLVMAPAALGMMAGAVVLGQFFRQIKRGTLIKSGFIIASLSLLVYSFVDYLGHWTMLPVAAVSAGVLFILGGANSLLDIPVNTLIQENTPEEVRGRVYGVVSMVVGVASLVPVIMAGALADAFGVRWVMFGGGLALVALTIHNFSHHNGTNIAQ